MKITEEETFVVINNHLLWMGCYYI